MVNWILIVVALAVLFVFFKTKDLKHRIWTLALLAVLLLLLFTVPQTNKDSGVDYNSFEGIIAATKVYFNWLGHIFDNIVSVTGNALKLDWTSNLTTGGNK